MAPAPREGNRVDRGVEPGAPKGQKAEQELGRQRAETEEAEQGQAKADEGEEEEEEGGKEVDVEANAAGERAEEGEAAAQTEEQAEEEREETEQEEDRDVNDERKEGEDKVRREDRAQKEGEQAHPWQAVWDANRGAWYFWNAKTNETTWTNPLEGTASAEADASTSGASAPAAAISDEELAQMHNLDPDLAYLDPGLYASQLSEARQAYNTSRGGGGSSNSNAIAAGAYATKGTFDARTGKFVPAAKTAEYDPSRLSHANQADRQMGAFFDVDAYNEERRRLREEEDMIEQAGGSRKRKPTKQDIQFYQQRKKEKKAAKLSWLRD